MTKYTCARCGQYSSDKTIDIKRHFGKKIKCSPTLNDTIPTMDNVIKTKENFICMYCSKIFVNKYSCNEHKINCASSIDALHKKIQQLESQIKLLTPKFLIEPK